MAGNDEPKKLFSSGKLNLQIASTLDSPTKAKAALPPGVKRVNTASSPVSSPLHTTDVNTILQFLHMSKKGKALIGLWGASTEKPCFQELVEIARQFPRSLGFIEKCSNELNTLLKSFKIMQWLDGSQEIPREDYFGQSVVAWPVTVLVQLTSWYVLCTDMTPDWKWHEVRDSFHSFLVFGKGMLSSIAASVASSEEEFIRHSLNVLKAAVWVGFSMQENNENINPKIDSFRTTYVLNVTNIALPVLEKIVEFSNKIPLDGRTKTYSSIEICRVLGPRQAYVCGHPLDLIRMERTIDLYQQKSGTRPGKQYEPFDGPVNSAYFSQRLPRDVVNAWRDDRIEFHGSHLKVAVISPHTGKNLQQVEGLSAELAFSLTMQQHNLLKFLPVVPVSSNFIDLGPSANGKDLLSKLLMNQLPNHMLTAISHPNLQVITPERVSPKRSTKRSVRKGTMLKCAIINEILDSLGVLGQSILTVELATWWRDLGMTRVALPSQGGTRRQPSGAPGTPDASQPGSRHLAQPGATPTAQSPSPLLPSPKFMGSTQMPSKGWDVVVDESTGDIKVLTSDEAAEELELRTSVTLTELAVSFTDRLSCVINRNLPPTLLIMCPTVASVIEVWDAYDLLNLDRIVAHRAGARGQRGMNTMTPMGNNTLVPPRRRLKSL